MRVHVLGAVLTTGAVLSVLALALVASPERMTKEELVEAASGPNAAASYEYRLSREEMMRLAETVKPYDCSSSGDLDKYGWYLCGVADYFVRDVDDLVPAGYMFESPVPSMEGGAVIGIRIVRTATP